MFYLESFENRYPELIGVLTSCGNLHSDPVVYSQQSGTLLGCSSKFLELFGVGSLLDIEPLPQWLTVEGKELSDLLSHAETCRGKIHVNGNEYVVTVKSEVIVLQEQLIVALVFRDDTIIEKARSAERYFNELKNKFLTNISHEFRTPMNAIIGFTDLLKSTPLSTSQYEYVELTSRSALSMMRNIENLLELMQVESGSVQPNLALFSPLEVFENFSMQFRDLARAKDIQLMFLIDPHLPKMMMGDQDKISSIMRNLIQNGIKFTEEKGQILVEILIVKEEGNYVEVEYSVSDTGVGIESERVKTLLRPFGSAIENQRKGKNGLGIGLSLSHKYVDMLDSHLMLASEYGKGSRFSFRVTHQINESGVFEFVENTAACIYTPEHVLSSQGALLQKYLELFKVRTTVIHDLINPALNESDVLFLDLPHISKTQIESIKSTYPRLQVVPIMKFHNGEKAEAVLYSAESIVTVPILPSSLHKTLAVIWNKMPKEYIARSYEAQSIPLQENIKILVAEDNLINLKLLETILLQQHFRVITVDNGQKAVDAYLKERFDLVLMDIDMPVMDGLMANRLIKEIDKRDNRGYVPVIALTAHALIGDRERIVAAGLDAHLAKPIDKHFLLQTIDRYLKIAQQKRQHNSI